MTLLAHASNAMSGKVSMKPSDSDLQRRLTAVWSCWLLQQTQPQYKVALQGSKLLRGL